MRVLPVDLRGASDTELADVLAVRRASRDVPDLPDPVAECAVPGRRIACWLGYDDDHPVGVLSLLLPDEGQCGYVLLDVHPERRRRGAARQLLTEAVRMSWALGRLTLRARCENGTPGSGFAHALGSVQDGSEDLVLPPPVAEREIPDGIDVLEVHGADAAALIARWAPDAHPSPDESVLHAVLRPGGHTAGLAGREQDRTGFVVLTPDADARLGSALAQRLGYQARPAVWMPHVPGRAEPILATRTRWALAVPELAARLGMC